MDRIVLMAHYQCPTQSELTLIHIFPGKISRTSNIFKVLFKLFRLACIKSG